MIKEKPEGGVEAFGLLHGGPGKGTEIAPPSRGPELTKGSREALLPT